MSMITNLRGRLHNTSLPYNSGLLPLFEAVVNSVHSIEEAELPSDSGKITVEIVRDTQDTLPLKDERKKRGPEPRGNILGFKITDNGIGFNEVNMESFLTLDGEHKANRGGRGVGRLLWLKAFKRVDVCSVYRNEKGEFESRDFVFNATTGVDNERCNTVKPNSTRATTVHLDGFEQRYREASNKTTRVIANSLFEHCLWYFVRTGGAPHIVVEDNNDSVALDKVYEEHMVSSAVTETISIKDVAFDLTHIKLRSNSSQTHTIAFCAANRLVKEELLRGKVPGLYGKLKDTTGEFMYSCYVSSSFLDNRVRSERTDFNITENSGGLFSQTEISLSDIRETVISRVSDYLSEYLDENRQRARDRIENFVSSKAPRYRPILSRIPEEELYIDPDLSDKDLELTLHRQLAKIESKLLADGHDVMEPRAGETFSGYEKRLKEYLRTASVIKKSDLVNYVFHRRVILEFLEETIRRGEGGKYAREEVIHELIMPMRKDSDEVMPDGCNLWLLDERLAFHDYLASEKTISSLPITSSTDEKRPDICALNVFDNPVLVSVGNSLPLASIVVVEIKRPMRDDASKGEDKDPIEQALGYLARIRKGTVKTQSGRLIPRSENIPGYCYVICDITASVEKRCEMHDAIRTSDGLGYFLYHKRLSAYVEVISFDGLVNAAKERNKAFFDKLGLPTT